MFAFTRLLQAFTNHNKTFHSQINTFCFQNEYEEDFTLMIYLSYFVKISLLPRM